MRLALVPPPPQMECQSTFVRAPYGMPSTHSLKRDPSSLLTPRPDRTFLAVAWQLRRPVSDGLASWLMVPDAPDPADLLEESTRRPSWHAEAACKGTGVDTFITAQGTPTEPAKAICGRCSVVEPCLRFALADTTLVGVWGGTSTEERRVMRREAA